MKIEDLNLSVRAYNVLKRGGIHTAEELQRRTDDELMRIRGMGKHSLEEIREKLESYPAFPAERIVALPAENISKSTCGTNNEERERLIRVLESAESAVYWNSSDRSFLEKIADHLIAHGVRPKTVVSLYSIWVDQTSGAVTASLQIDGVGFEVPVQLDLPGQRMIELMVADKQGRLEILPAEGETADKDIKKAIKLLEREYEKALNLKFVRNPLAYALFNVWKIADKKTPKEDERKE